MGQLKLEIRKTIRAGQSRVFDAWTHPEIMREWWGPKGVTCIGVEMDSRVGGKYRIGNALPDGKEIWIAGEFIQVTRPEILQFTWCIEDAGGKSVPGVEIELVTVSFKSLGDQTEIFIFHEKIGSEAAQKAHQEGWEGCLSGLENYVSI